jgi:hypothetical protein
MPPSQETALICKDRSTTIAVFVQPLQHILHDLLWSLLFLLGINAKSSVPILTKQAWFQGRWHLELGGISDPQRTAIIVILALVRP